MSESHFSHVFRQTVGLPPQRYIWDRRIRASQGIAARVRFSISEKSAEVGSSCASNFLGTLSSRDGHDSAHLQERQLKAVASSVATSYGLGSAANFVTLATARPVLSGIFAICVMTSFLCESILMTLFTLRFAAARVGTVV